LATSISCSLLDSTCTLRRAAIPYEDRERDATLSAKFKVDGIPTLVVLDGATGHVVDPDAGGKVSTAKTLTGIFSN